MTLESIIKNYVKKYKISGISVGRVRENDLETFNYGEIKKGTDITPTSDTIYEIGSMTKTFTVILTVKVQETNYTKLTTSRYLSDLTSCVSKEFWNVRHLDYSNVAHVSTYQKNYNAKNLNFWVMS